MVPDPELILSGTRSGSPTERFELRFGEVTSFEGRPAQVLQVQGAASAFYVDRAQVLALLDLL